MHSPKSLLAFFSSPKLLRKSFWDTKQKNRKGEIMSNYMKVNRNNIIIYGKSSIQFLERKTNQENFLKHNSY